MDRTADPVAAPARAPRSSSNPTRERLLRAARAVVEEGGYGAASVVAIARRAGVSTGALYRHYPSKAELFVAVFRAASSRELVAMRRASTLDGTVVERIEATLGTFAERALRNRRLAWALVAEPVDPLVDAERLVYRRAYRERLAELLRAGIAAGEIPAQDADLTAAALVGATAEALVGPLSPLAGETLAAAEIVAALRAFARRAVGARPGKERARPGS